MNNSAFELLHEENIPELSTLARLYRHVQTGAELLSLENDDENKVFGVTFRTPPEDSTGVPHIMEHAVLCGSRKYPVKEPYVELVKGSLKTFVNAMTFPDKTCYPVASTNLQDFYNLIDVYLDAIFYPLIPARVLDQEGWHYELDELDAPLNFKGVVFNEMKGAYSSPDSNVYKFSQQVLFPDTIYGLDSGGDPQVIPDLTYAQFKAFHAKYYHPSNARIYFYGDDDPQQRLALVDAYLRDFSPLAVDSAIPIQPPQVEPQTKTITYASGEEPEALKGMLTVNWLFPEFDDPQEALALRILTYILIGTPASPLRKALIDAGLGEDLTGVGLEDDLRQMYFSTGLKGLAVDAERRVFQAGEVEHLMLETLERLARQGLDPETVAASMNTIEFRLRENNTGAFPRGLAWMFRAMQSWLYGRDPLAMLRFAAPLKAIQNRVASGERFFESLIQKYLLDNPHRVTLILEPDPGLTARREAEERARLDAALTRMDQSERQAVLENTRFLKHHQETPDTPEALATIPSLRRSDLEPKHKPIPLEVLTRHSAPLLYHDLFTNGILYLDLGFDLHNLPADLVPYTPVYGRALLELGTTRQDFVRLSQRIGQHTGGIYPTTMGSAVTGSERAAAYLFMRAKATQEKAGELFHILGEVLLEPQFDNQERLRQLVLEMKADQESLLAPAGHRLVNTRLRAAFDQAGWLNEQIGGIEQLFFLRRLAERLESDWSGVLADLQQLHRLLVQRANLVVNVTQDGAGWQVTDPQLQSFLEQLPAGDKVEQHWGQPDFPPAEGLTFPARVNYVGKGANLYELGYELHGSIQAVLLYLRTTWLWERVRVQGGAYGGMCSFDHRSGVFTYLSYRDPNLMGTLANYDGAASYLQTLDLSDEELTRSLIGAIGEVDAYMLPDAKGFTSLVRYLTGDSDERRQRQRDQLLAATVDDFHRLGDALARLNSVGRVVVLGAPEAIQAADQAGNGWLKVTHVL